MSGDRAPNRHRAAVLLLAGAAAAGWWLTRSAGEPVEVPAGLVGRALPVLPAPRLEVEPRSPEARSMAALLAPRAAAIAVPAGPAGRLETARLAGRPWVLNVFASWCPGCRDEHALLLRHARDEGVALVGLDVQDRPEDLGAWLGGAGSPFLAVLRDDDGGVAASLGIQALPQTLVIGADGVVRLQLMGALTEAAWNARVRPLLEAGGR